MVEELWDDVMAVLGRCPAASTECGRRGVDVDFFGDAPARRGED
ncbi:hypothetical protein [Rhodococcus opacus]|nr:hypothetical protein [Rhodococcus opacus]